MARLLAEVAPRFLAQPALCGGMSGASPVGTVLACLLFAAVGVGLAKLEAGYAGLLGLLAFGLRQFHAGSHGEHALSGRGLQSFRSLAQNLTAASMLPIHAVVPEAVFGRVAAGSSIRNPPTLDSRFAAVGSQSKFRTCDLAVNRWPIGERCESYNAVILSSSRLYHQVI